MKYLSSAVFCVFLATTGYGQTTLTELYKDLHSSDPKVRDAASRNSTQILSKEFPEIEKETQTICDGLTDSNDTVRQDSSAILNVIVYLHPDKNSVVSACTPQLLKTGADPIDQIRENSLAALALKSGGAPQAAAPLFDAALNDRVIAARQIAATGILNLPTGTSLRSVQLLTSRMTSEQNPEAKRALLMGAIQSRKTNPDVAAAASGLIADVDAEVQGAAIFAVEALNDDKTRALNELQNYKTSQLLNPEVKSTLDSAIRRLQNTTH